MAVTYKVNISSASENVREGRGPAVWLAAPLLWTSVRLFLRNLTMGRAYDPGIHTKDMKSAYQRHLHIHVYFELYI